MNFPQTVDELIHWDVPTGRDTFGIYHVITGFEGTGGCFWCGEELEGGRRRFCGHRSGHWTLYANHFYWGYARTSCLEHYNYTCANCGHHIIVPYGHHPSWYTKGLEVHHIIPRKDGGTHNLTNLITLCEKHHKETYKNNYGGLNLTDLLIQQGKQKQLADGQTIYRKKAT